MIQQVPAAGQTLAALDLGSNSFHMVIAEQVAAGGLQIIDRVKEMVRLNAGLDESGNLSEDSQLRALDCLQRFSQRLRDIPPSQVRAVGTNTFRAAHNSAEFISRAEDALGHHISVISGHEEARLVYLGAAFSLEISGRRRLVIDIGGSSTELMIGQGHDTVTMDSLYIGCVSMSRQYFPEGLITP
ncbi:MAG: exopolyphosphatase, partial [Gammaproteobacteria bacterium]|nr:exopolyphosphatase [Gammaproteobacteria bacterium]